MSIWGDISGAASSAVSTVSHAASSAASTVSHAASSVADSVSSTVSSAGDSIAHTVSSTADQLGSVAKQGLDAAGSALKSANDAAASWAQKNDPMNLGEQFHQWTSDPLGKALDQLNPLTPFKAAAALGYDTISSAVGDVKSIAQHPQTALDIANTLNPVGLAASAVEGGVSLVSPSAAHALQNAANSSNPLISNLPGLGAFRLAQDPKQALQVGGSMLDLGLDIASVAGVGEIGKAAELGGKEVLENGGKEVVEDLVNGADHAKPPEVPTVPETPSFPKQMEVKPPAVDPVSGTGKVADLHLPDVNPEQGTHNCEYCTREIDAALDGKGTQFPQTGPDYGVPKAYEANKPQPWADEFKKLTGAQGNWAFTQTADDAARSSAISGIEGQLSQAGDHGALYVSQGKYAHILNVANLGGEVVAIDGQTGVYGSIQSVLKADGYDAANSLGFIKTN